MASDEFKVSILDSSEQPTEDTFPHISKALLEKLESIFRDRCPALSASERTVWFTCGQVDVVRRLRNEYEDQRAKQNKG